MNPFNQEMENDSVVENSQTFPEVEVEDLKEQNLDDKVSWRDFPEGKFRRGHREGGHLGSAKKSKMPFF